MSARIYCSFCGQSDKEVKTLVAGPMVFICDECIKLCAQIVQMRESEDYERDKLTALTIGADPDDFIPRPWCAP